MNEYISTINSLVADAMSGRDISRLTSAGVVANLPSALRCQCVRDAKSIVKKHYKACHDAVLKNRRLKIKGSKSRVVAPAVPILRRPYCYINNQNFKINGDRVEFPVIVDGKSKRISVKTKMDERQRVLLTAHKLGTLRIVVKNRRIVAQVVYDVEELKPSAGSNVMGVDLGIKCPAVSYCSGGHVMFYGNGRQNKYMRRHFKMLRERLQKAKKPSAVKRINDKEQRIMKDIDHKISRKIVSEAKSRGVSIIKLEQLANIRSATRTSRKNNPSLHTWSFYELPPPCGVSYGNGI